VDSLNPERSILGNVERIKKHYIRTLKSDIANIATAQILRSTQTREIILSISVYYHRFDSAGTASASESLDEGFDLPLLIGRIYSRRRDEADWSGINIKAKAIDRSRPLNQSL